MPDNTTPDPADQQLEPPKDLGVREPEGDSKKQLERIQKRNRELMDGDAEPGHDGEREINGGESVKSVPSQTGDYASD